MSGAETDSALFIHVDIDSPETLLRFWGRKGRFDAASLDGFYNRAMERALALFKECAVPATFFCVGADLEKSGKAAERVREAFRAGHEIANHSYSHPYGMTGLEPRGAEDEIKRCSDVIERITGKRPVGFRAPSFDVNAQIIGILEKLGFEYDSSVFYSILGSLMKFYHRVLRQGDVPSGYNGRMRAAPRGPYFPNRSDHWVPGPPRGIVELPLPRSPLGLPFYHNFHLSMGWTYSRFDIARMRQAQTPYLFHLVEFCDLRDGLPEELAVHPNLKMDFRVKLERIKKTIRLFKKHYRIMRTDRFVESFKGTGKGVLAGAG